MSLMSDTLNIKFDENQLASIKKPNAVEKISKAELEARIRALANSKRDIIWWANNFFRIVTLDKGLTIIKLYPKQEEFLKHLVENTRTVCLSSRQLGKTTTYTIFCLWLATLFVEKKIMICANKLQTALEIMDRIKTAYDFLPDFIKPGVTVYNKGTIEFSNRSKIMAFSTSSSGARGSSANCIVLDEFAFVPKNIASDFIASVMPIISSSKNAKAIIVSTPNGASGQFYDIWQQANSKDKSINEEGWTPFRMYWWEAPGRDETWKKQQIATIGLERWKQEFECEFLVSTTQKLIPDDITEKYRIAIGERKLKKTGIGTPLVIVSENGDLSYEYTMWHPYDPRKTYAASADVSEGGGGDYSVLYVWDISDLSNIIMCAKYESNRISVTEFAYLIKKLLFLYNNPYVILERNGIGSGCIDSLYKIYGYENIVREGKDNTLGVYSHYQVKAKSCLWARDMLTIQGFGFTIYDDDLIDEFSTFVKKNTKGYQLSYMAIPGTHDDHIMSFIWLCYLLQNEVIDRYYITVGTFTSSLGNVYAKIVKPMKVPTINEVETVLQDPTYRQYKKFNAELREKLGIKIQAEMNDDLIDQFTYKPPVDRFFGGYDTSPSWTAPNIKLDPDQVPVSPFNVKTIPFYIIGGGRGW